VFSSTFSIEPTSLIAWLSKALHNRNWSQLISVQLNPPVPFSQEQMADEDQARKNGQVPSLWTSLRDSKLRVRDVFSWSDIHLMSTYRCVIGGKKGKEMPPCHRHLNECEYVVWCFNKSIKANLIFKKVTFSK
jgi:hypothetical protein